MWLDLLRCPELSWQLAMRDIKAQYRQAALGYLWVFALPAANTALWLFLNATGILTIQDAGVSYPVFVMTGTILWSIFMDAVNAPLQQTTAAKPLLAKINFPRESLIVSGVIQTLFNASVRLIVLLLALMILGESFGWTLALAPIGVLALTLVGTMIGVFLTPIGLLYSDIGRSLPLLLQFLMYFCPVVYPLPESGFGSSMLQWNPLTPLIVTARSLVLGDSPDMLGVTLGICACAIVLLFLAWIAYRLAMPIMIERMGT